MKFSEVVGASDSPFSLSARSLHERIYAILSAYPAGVKEFDLLQRLREAGVELFQYDSPADSLALFRVHFLLFHHLYLMRDQLRHNGGADLEIHCLGIVLRPYNANPDNLPGATDLLRDYYLELRHLQETGAAEVEALLTEFWRRYARMDERAAALELLNLQGTATRTAIRERYRELAKQHHPDSGGDAAKFRAIREAAAILLGE